MLKNALMFAAAATVLAMFAPQLLASYMPEPAPVPALAAARAASAPPNAAPVVQTARTELHGERSIPPMPAASFPSTR